MRVEIDAKMKQAVEQIESCKAAWFQNAILTPLAGDPAFSRRVSSAKSQMIELGKD